MAKVKRDEETSHHEVGPKLDKGKEQKKEKKADQEKIIEHLVKTDNEDFVIKRPYETAQYHQCIPNPKREGEYITV